MAIELPPAVTAVIADPTIPGSAKAIYAFLLIQPMTDGACDPSIATICTHMAMDKKTVIGHLDTLVDRGAISRIGTQRGRQYRLLPVAESTTSVAANGGENGTIPDSNGGENGTIPETAATLSPYTRILNTKRVIRTHAHTRGSESGGEKAGGNGAAGLVATTPLPDGTILLDPTGLVDTLCRHYDWPDDDRAVLVAWVETHGGGAARPHDMGVLRQLVATHGRDQVESCIRRMGDEGQLKIAHLKRYLAEPVGAAAVDPVSLGFHTYEEMQDLASKYRKGSDYWKRCTAFKYRGKSYFWPNDRPLPSLTTDYERVS